MVERPSEEEDVGLGIVSLVVLPARGLLHAKRPPLGFREEASRELLCKLLGQNHMSGIQKIKIYVQKFCMKLGGKITHLYSNSSSLYLSE